MNTMPFYEFRSEQTSSGSGSYIFKENKIISLTNLFQQSKYRILRIYLNEKLNFCHHSIERNAQMQDQKICFIILFLLILKYDNGNH